MTISAPEAPAVADPGPLGPGAPPEGARVDSLTGLRFLAALAVFAHHFTGLGGNGSGVANTPALFPYTTMGVHGVDFFFVLSGFLLTWGHRPGTPAGLFYWRRVGRVWPAHLVATVPAVVMFYVWGDAATDLFSQIASLFLLQAWFPGVSPTLPGNPVSWTLGVEMFFYLLFPLVIRYALRLRTRTLGLLTGGGLAAMWAVNWWAAAHLSPFATEWIMRHPVTRLPEFVLGVVFALALRRGHRFPLHPGVLAAAFLGYTLVYCRRADWFEAGVVGQFDWTVRPTVAVFAVLVIAACVQRETAGHKGWLCSRPMVLLGLWSYSFYLLHQTLNRCVINAWGRPEPSNAWVFMLVGVCVVATGLAWALYRYVEEPARVWWSSRTPARWRVPVSDMPPPPRDSPRRTALLFPHDRGTRR